MGKKARMREEIDTLTQAVEYRDAHLRELHERIEGYAGELRRVGMLLNAPVLFVENHADAAKVAENTATLPDGARQVSVNEYVTMCRDKTVGVIGGILEKTINGEEFGETEQTAWVPVVTFVPLPLSLEKIGEFGVKVGSGNARGNSGEVASDEDRLQEQIRSGDTGGSDGVHQPYELNCP